MQPRGHSPRTSASPCFLLEVDLPGLWFALLCVTILIWPGAPIHLSLSCMLPGVQGCTPPAQLPASGSQGMPSSVFLSQGSSLLLSPALPLHMALLSPLPLALASAMLCFLPHGPLPGASQFLEVSGTSMGQGWPVGKGGC